MHNPNPRIYDPAHAASPDAEIATLYAEYTAGRERASELDRSSPGKSSEETDRIHDEVYALDARCDEIGERVAHLHATTSQGIALKLRIVFGMAGYRSDDPGFRKLKPCERAVALGLWTAIADAERLAAGDAA